MLRPPSHRRKNRISAPPLAPCLLLETPEPATCETFIRAWGSDETGVTIKAPRTTPFGREASATAGLKVPTHAAGTLSEDDEMRPMTSVLPLLLLLPTMTPARKQAMCSRRWPSVSSTAARASPTRPASTKRVADASATKIASRKRPPNKQCRRVAKWWRHASESSPARAQASARRLCSRTALREKWAWRWQSAAGTGNCDSSAGFGGAKGGGRARAMMTSSRTQIARKLASSVRAAQAWRPLASRRRERCISAEHDACDAAALMMPAGQIAPALAAVSGHKEQASKRRAAVSRAASQSAALDGRQNALAAPD